MSNKITTSPAIRWQLLSTVSAVALLASAFTGSAQATDSDAGQPLIWIELGGELTHSSGEGQVFAPDFLSAYATSDVLQGVTPTGAQKLPAFAFGEDAKVSFQPKNSDWVFSAAIRYGRSRTSREVDHQTNGVFYRSYKYGIPHGNQYPVEKFSDTKAHNGERYAILDFSAGKDVGLGLFGNESSSLVSFGVRFAQFRSGETVDIRARPDLNFYDISLPTYHFRLHLPYFHTYHATGKATRNFHGIGPSLSWSGSAPFAGNVQDGELTVDWGANAALLFGRQTAHVRHHESAHYASKHFALVALYQTVYDNPPTGHDTERSVTTPNVGGSIGISWRLQDFKVSLGYRADFFFGAMDTGIDTVKKSNVIFNGPYASISIGLP